MEERRNVDGAASIRIEGNAVGSALVTGDGNTVTIIYATGIIPTIYPPVGSNPYRGLNAFDESSSKFFFGRERVVQRIIRDIERITAPIEDTRNCRLFAIVGPSGSGKTSIARAGVLPALAYPRAPWLRNPNVAILTPGPCPMESLADALSRMVAATSHAGDMQREFVTLLRSQSRKGQHDGINQIVQKYSLKTPILVLVDQFEETYTLCRSGYIHATMEWATAERDSFVSTLLHAAQSSDCISVLLTLRSDFLGALSEHPRLSNAVAAAHEIVPALNREDLERAIAEPARIAGQPIDRTTIDRILNEAGGEVAALPLVQFALEHIWNGLSMGVAPGDTLISLGGVGGALAKRANDVLATLSEAQQKLARRAFLGAVQLGDVAARDTRRRVFLTELVPANSSVDKLREAIEPFVQARLLMVGATEKHDLWIELPHEALIRCWNEFRFWIDIYREDIRFGRQFQAVAESWDRTNRPSGSLWRPPDLDILRRYVARTQEPLTRVQFDFLRASERRAAIEKSVLRAFVISIVVLAILSVLLAVLANNKRREADARRRTAISSSLAANARLLFDQGGTKQQLAALLISESLLREPTAQVSATARLISSSLLVPQHVMQFPESVESMTMTQDGRYIAIHLFSPDVKSAVVVIAEPETGKELKRQTFVTAGGVVLAMAFSSDGAILAISGGVNTILWRWQTSIPPFVIPYSSTELAFSSNNKWLVGNEHTGVYIISVDTAAQRLIKMPYDLVLPPFVLSPVEGHTLFIGTTDGQVTIWDVRTGKKYKSFPATGIYLDAPPNTPYSDYFGSSKLKKIRVPHRIGTMAISPDGSFLCVVDSAGVGRFWAVKKTAVRRVATLQVGYPVQIGFDQHSQFIISSPGEGAVSVWDIHTGKQLATQQLPGFGRGSAMSFDGTRVVSARSGDTVIVWDWKKKKILARASHDSEVTSFILRGDILVTASHDGSIVSWQMPQLVWNGKRFNGRIGTLSVSDNGQIVGASTDPNATVFWKPFETKDILSLQGFAQEIQFDKEGKSVALANGATVYVRNLSTNQTLFTRDFPQKIAEQVDRSDAGSRTRFVLTSNKAAFANLLGDLSKRESVPIADLTRMNDTASDQSLKKERTLRIAMPDLPRNEPSIPSYSQSNVHVALSPDAQWLAVAAFDWVWVFDLNSGDIRSHHSLGYEIVSNNLSKLNERTVDPTIIENMWFNDEGDQLFAYTQNGALWRLNTTDGNLKMLTPLQRKPLHARSILVEPTTHGAEIRRFDGGVLRTLSFSGAVIAVSPDGRWLAVQRYPGMMTDSPAGTDASDPKGYGLDIIEVDKGAVVHFFPDNASLESAVFSQDSKLLASVGSDGTVRVFEVRSGEEVDRIVEHPVGDKLTFVSGSKEYLIDISADLHDVTIWKLGRDELIHDLCQKTSRKLSNSEWVDFLPGETPRDTCKYFFSTTQQH